MGGQLIYVLRREKLHHLGVPEEVPRGRVHLPRARRDAMVRTLWYRAVTDGSGRGPAHHDTYDGFCALSRQRAGTDGAAGLGDHSVDADVNRRSSRESAAKLSD